MVLTSDAGYKTSYDGGNVHDSLMNQQNCAPLDDDGSETPAAARKLFDDFRGPPSSDYASVAAVAGSTALSALSSGVSQCMNFIMTQRASASTADGPLPLKFMGAFAALMLVIYSILQVVNIFRIFTSPATYIQSLFQIFFGLLLMSAEFPEQAPLKQALSAVPLMRSPLARALFYIFTGTLNMTRGVLSFFLGLFLLLIGVADLAVVVSGHGGEAYGDLDQYDYKVGDEEGLDEENGLQDEPYDADNLRVHTNTGIYPTSSRNPSDTNTTTTSMDYTGMEGGKNGYFVGGNVGRVNYAM